MEAKGWYTVIVEVINGGKREEKRKEDKIIQYCTYGGGAHVRREAQQDQTER
jgi:hypothetical protein